MSTHDLTPPSPEERRRLEAALTAEERSVLLEHGTERPFCGAFVDQKQPGDQLRACEGQPDRYPAAQTYAADRHRSTGKLLLDELRQGASRLGNSQGRLRAARATERRELRHEEAAVGLQLRQQREIRGSGRAESVQQ